MNAAVITLCVAIATFILQEGLSNIIHGFIFRFLSHVKKGDRVQLLIDGNTYTGYLEKITLRHTIIKEFSTNALITVPNAKIDCSLLKNEALGYEQLNRYIVELPVSYRDAEDPETAEIIKQEIKGAIRDCPLTTDNEFKVYINFKESFVSYSFFIRTQTVEENFEACSWVREKTMQRLAKRDIHVPYSVLDVKLNEML
ncbi:MAG: mechanosensitive ion channel family protein [Eubacterium sp.]|nr:mechanosensitive ion channel family protein [Eubacterium sp.]